MSTRIDTVIFDVDGVLWDTGDSFDQAVIQTVDHVLRRWFHVPQPDPVTREELRLFRRAGGLNNDWDMAYTLAALRLAGRTDREQAAAESNGRGRAWAETLLPPGVHLDYPELVRLFNEIYWGAADFRRLFGQAPRHVADAPGTWHRERPLWAPDLFHRLQAAGVRHFGLATGRNRMELATVLQVGGLDRFIPAQARITGDVLQKPDGRVLATVLARLHQVASAQGMPPPQAAVYCGDTADDVAAVHNYRRLAGPDATPIYAVAVVPPEEADFFRTLGADVVVSHVEELPPLLERLAAEVSV